MQTLVDRNFLYALTNAILVRVIFPQEFYSFIYTSTSVTRGIHASLTIEQKQLRSNRDTRGI